MRIVAGKYKSRLIDMPKRVKIRPTQDRIREAIFNILGRRCVGARVLDLYSGSGALGIEALSRGAREAAFIDSNKKCIKAIKGNLSSLNIEYNIDHNYEVVQVDALRFIELCSAKELRFDLIFLDPPYHKGMAEKTLIELDKCDIITCSGVVIAENFKKNKIPESLNNLKLIRQNTYGDTMISFYNALKTNKLGE